MTNKLLYLANRVMYLMDTHQINCLCVVAIHQCNFTCNAENKTPGQCTREFVQHDSSTSSLGPMHSPLCTFLIVQVRKAFSAHADLNHAQLGRSEAEAILQVYAGQSDNQPGTTWSKPHSCFTPSMHGHISISACWYTNCLTVKYIHVYVHVHVHTHDVHLHESTCI